MGVAPPWECDVVKRAVVEACVVVVVEACVSHTDAGCSIYLSELRVVRVHVAMEAGRTAVTDWVT